MTRRKPFFGGVDGRALMLRLDDSEQQVRRRSVMRTSRVARGAQRRSDQKDLIDNDAIDGRQDMLALRNQAGAHQRHARQVEHGD